MSVRRPAVVYVEIDHSDVALYDYRSPHFMAARQLGWGCITIVAAGHPRIRELRSEVDILIELPELSVAAVIEAVRQISGEYDVRALFSYPGQMISGIDVPDLIEEACATLGLVAPSADALARCNNKYATRETLARAGLPSVNFAVIQSEEDLSDAASNVGFPLIMKPVFGAGSALIRKCEDLETLQSHYRKFKQDYGEVKGACDFGGGTMQFETMTGDVVKYEPGATVMLESYIEGLEATIECVVVDDAPIPLLLHEKLLVTFEDATVLEHLLVVPSVSLSEGQVQQAMDYAHDCIAAMGLKRSFVHFEFRMTPEGPRMIEINPRIGGFYVHRSLKDVAGIDPFLTNLAMLSGEDGAEIETPLKARTAAMDQLNTMFVVYPPKAGNLKGINGQFQAAQRLGIRDFSITAHRGPITAEKEENYVAKFWAQVDSADAAIELYNSVKSDLQIEIEVGDIV